jgi:glycosyltransferase involved in cell wall biosynthesis
MARLIASRPELPFTVKIAGEGREGGNLQRLIQQLDLEQRVTLLGRRLDIPGLLSQSDIFVMASDSEGTPNAVMEAMAAGLPVVATDVGDVPRLVADGINGFVVPCNETGEYPMASALAKLLTDPGLRARMGAAGRARAESEFGLDRLAERVLKAYRQAGWRQS